VDAFKNMKDRMGGGIGELLTAGAIIALLPPKIRNAMFNAFTQGIKDIINILIDATKNAVKDMFPKFTSILDFDSENKKFTKYSESKTNELFKQDTRLKKHLEKYSNVKQPGESYSEREMISNNLSEKLNTFISLTKKEKETGDLNFYEKMLLKSYESNLTTRGLKQLIEDERNKIYNTNNSKELSDTLKKSTDILVKAMDKNKTSFQMQPPRPNINVNSNSTNLK
jgi:hypothetical protein